MLRSKSVTLYCFLWLSACHVAAPEFVVQGVQLNSALESLAEIQKNGKKDKLGHYVQHLRGHHAPGFAWDQYWAEIQKQRLQANMTAEELSLLFSLNQVSCQPKYLDSFAKVLLETVKADLQKVPLIRLELGKLRDNCSTALSNSSFKSFIEFLSQERGKTEKSQINKDRQQLINPLPQGVSSLLKKYIYTEELQAVLLQEWFFRPKHRSWSDILTVVDKGFFSDVRWINWQNQHTEYLKNTLRMEFSTYQHISHLEADILWLFKNNNKMAKLLALFGYEKYLTSPGALHWPSLVKTLSTQYPSPPQNGNVPALVSLFSRSCEVRDFPPFFSLLKQWEVSDVPDLGFCLPGGESVPLTSEELATKPLADDLAGVENVKQAFSHFSTVDSVMYLLALYEREKYKRPLSEWGQFLEYFSEEEWLKVMRFLRKNQDRESIARILDVHSRVYQGPISFLAEDIWSVMLSEKENLSDMLQKGYSVSYMNHPQTLSAFWKKVKSMGLEKSAASGDSPASRVDLKQKNTDKISVQLSLQLKPSGESVQCSADYVQNLYRFFSESNKTDLLLKQFRFDQCAEFILDFRKKEWSRLVYLFRAQKDLSTNTESGSEDLEVFMPNNQLVWWMARVLSLPHSLTLSTQALAEEGDEWLAQVFDSFDKEEMSANRAFVPEAVSDLSADEWKRFFRIMIDSLKVPKFEIQPIMFRYMSRLLRTSYPLALEHSICEFLAQEDSHHLIAEYPSAFIWDLFLQVDWTRSSPTLGRYKRSNNNICAGLVSSRRVNALLLVLSQGIFAGLSAEGVPVDIYIEQVKRQADHLTDLFNTVRSFDKKGAYYFDIQRSLAQWRIYTSLGGIFWTSGGYNMERGYISDQALVFYFAGMILKKLTLVIQDKTSFNDEVEKYLSAGSASQNSFDSAYKVYLENYFYLIMEILNLN